MTERNVTLQVNECQIWATQAGSEWWGAFSRRFHHPVGRIVTIKMTIAGNLVAVACDDRDHAEWLRDTAIANGVPKSALKIKRQPTNP